jgi:hypothetical protein
MLEAKHIVRMFSRMLHLYGHRWASVYGAATTADGILSASAQQWLYDLRELTPEKVAHGLEQVVAKRLEWPPGPIEFLNLCEGVPTIAEVLDRDHDYGPICRAIRGRMDWFMLESMSAQQMRQLAQQQIESAIVHLRRSGSLAAVVAAVPQRATAAIGVAS